MNVQFDSILQKERNTYDEGYGPYTQDFNRDTNYDLNPELSLSPVPDITNYLKEFIVFRPLELLLMDPSKEKGLSPYCKFKIGYRTTKTHPAVLAGDNYSWTESVFIERKRNELFAKIKVKNIYGLVLWETIGENMINLEDMLGSVGRATEWVNLYKNGQKTAELHLAIERTNAEIV